MIQEPNLLHPTDWNHFFQPYYVTNIKSQLWKKTSCWMKDDCEAPIELLYSCRMQSSMCAHQVWLAYSVVQVFCFLDLLYSCSIHYWKWDAKVSNYHYWIVYFSLNLFIFALFIYLGSFARCIYVYNSYIFSTDLPFYYYKMSLFSFDNIFKVSFIQYSYPKFLWLLFA